MTASRPFKSFCMSKTPFRHSTVWTRFTFQNFTSLRASLTKRRLLQFKSTCSTTARTVTRQKTTSSTSSRNSQFTKGRTCWWWRKSCIVCRVAQELLTTQPHR